MNTVNTFTAKSSSAKKIRLNPLIRWLHVYTSMISLLVVLFFALTGFTLNHTDWAFGDVIVNKQFSGSLPQDWRKGTQTDWLRTAEYLRATHGLRGQVKNPRSSDTETSLSFVAPAYKADVFINLSGSYNINLEAQGFVALMNDLHRGRDTGTAWSWLIDVSALFLVVVALTGLGLLLYLKKTRMAALATALGGGILMIVLMRLTM